AISLSSRWRDIVSPLPSFLFSVYRIAPPGARGIWGVAPCRKKSAGHGDEIPAKKRKRGAKKSAGPSGPADLQILACQKASQSSAARRRRKKIKSFFRRRVRRKNTLREASVESSAIGGRPRRRAERDPFGGKGVSLFRQSQICGARRPRRFGMITIRNPPRCRRSST